MKEDLKRTPSKNFPFLLCGRGSLKTSLDRPIAEPT